MFTVLIRYQKTRREVLLHARTVEFVSGPPSDRENRGLLINHGVEGENGCFLAASEEKDENWRDVFVMNGEGQTVARYTL